MKFTIKHVKFTIKTIKKELSICALDANFKQCEFTNASYQLEVYDTNSGKVVAISRLTGMFSYSARQQVQVMPFVKLDGRTFPNVINSLYSNICTSKKTQQAKTEEMTAELAKLVRGIR